MSKDLFFQMREKEINEIEVVDFETVLPMQGLGILTPNHK